MNTWLPLAISVIVLLVIVPYYLAVLVWGIRWSPRVAAEILHGHVRDAADPRGSERLRPLEIVHPYLGYVLNPAATDSDWTEAGWSRPVVNRFGFESLADPLNPDSGKLRIAVVGGSVAKAFANGAGGQRLTQVLCNEMHTRVEICCLSVGGYKAPQSLLAVTYMLALGARWHAVLNIDGFNEVVLHPAEAAGRAVCPTFPRSWYGRAVPYTSWRRSALMRRATLLRARRRTIARVTAGSPLRHIPLAFVLAETLDTALNDEVQKVERRLLEERKLENLVNCDVMAGDPAALVSLWANNSLILDSLCRGQGIAYFHFLQPNQYDVGAKPLSAEERRSAFLDGHPYQPYAKQAYPLLRDEGRRLSAAGVAFCDLSRIFAAEERTIYIDRCCHLNDYGNKILGSAIASYLCATWSNAAQSAPADGRRSTADYVGEFQTK